MISKVIPFAEKNFLPDWLIRIGIRQLMKAKLKEQSSLYSANVYEQKTGWINSMKESPVAFSSGKANKQHYEVPAEFFEQVLGPRMKYSSCVWDSNVNTLEEAENQMLHLTAERSGIKDGMKILDLGCGWGSFSLYIAENYPLCDIVSVSNSNDQGNYIRKVCRDRGYSNVSFIKADMNKFDTDLRFDRIVSIEMFEHMRNYKLMLERISNWLKKDGSLFLHFFCHKDYAYPYEVNSNSDWMTRYFFTGGMMPSFDLLHYFQDDLVLINSWQVNGRHYKKTCRAWLSNQDKKGEIIMKIFHQFYGEDSNLWFYRWRIFWMACEELFAFNDGKEWFVGHFLMKKRQ